MTEFENDLRRRLDDAAQLAPAYRPATTTARPRRREPLLVAGLAAAAVAVVAVAAVAAGTFWWGVGGGPGPREQVADPGGSSSVHVDKGALCVALLELDGRTYTSTGWTRLPRQGPSLGDARLPRCGGDGPQGEDETAEAFAGVGFAPSSVVLTDETIWVVGGAEVPGLDELTTPVRCTGTGTATTSGRLDGVETTDGNAGAVTGLELTLTRGPEWLMRSDAAVRLTAAVREEHAAAYGSLGQALRSGEDAVRVQLSCSEGRFVTVALLLTS